MRDRDRFARLMLALSLGLKMYGREFSFAFQEVYWTALAELTDDEFERAAAVLLKREIDFPPPAMFLEIARPRTDSMAEAHAVMCRALLLTDYDPEGGSTWRASRIREEIGVAAYEGFLACGGAPGFRDYDSPFHGARVRREFCEVYARAVAADPTTALPAPKPPALPSPELEALTEGIGLDMPRLERPPWAEHYEVREAPRLTAGPPLTPEQIEAKREAFRELARQEKAAKEQETPSPQGVA